MRSLRLPVTLLVLAGCPQEFTVTEKDTDPPDVVDTDPAGTIGAPDIEIVPMELNFGGLPPDCDPISQSATITNVGDAPLTVSEITLAGAASGVYAFSGLTLPITLQPEETQSFTISFEPTDFTAYNAARVVVNSDDPDEATVNVNLKGTGSDFAFGEAVFIQEPRSNKVDVIWVLDNSCSMSDDVDELAQAIPGFFTSFQGLGLDYQVGVTSTDTSGTSGPSGGLFGPIITPQSAPNPTAAFRSQADAVFNQAGDTGMGSARDTERGFKAARDAIAKSAPGGINDGLIRADATLAVVVISDEDDADSTLSFSGPAGTANTTGFVSDLDGLKADPADTSFSGMVGPQNTNCGGLLGLATKAPHYHYAIRQTGGVHSNICNRDFGPFLNFLSYTAVGLLVEFPLPVAVEAFTLIQVEVRLADGTIVNPPYSPLNGWTYDEDTQSVVFHGDAVPEPGSTVTIQYPLPDCSN